MLEQHLSNTDDICKIVDPVYAMGRTIEERMGIKRFKKNTKKKGEGDENRRIRKLEKKVKESRQLRGYQTRFTRERQKEN